MNAFKSFAAAVFLYLVPLLSVLVLECAFYVPRFSAFLNFLHPAPLYAGIYFWLSTRPDAFSLISAFILGICADVLSASPVGINVLSFLLLYGLTLWLSGYFNIKKFAWSWLLFFVVSLITLLFKALVVSAFYRRLIPLNTLLFEFLPTVMLYPLLVRYYMWTERRFIHLEERYEKV